MKAAVRDEHFRSKNKDTKGKKAQDPRKVKDKEKESRKGLERFWETTREATEYFVMDVLADLNVIDPVC